jgi:type I restriction enzyme R subunit
MAITERDFEDTIESTLLAGGPDDPEQGRALKERFTFPGDFTPGGYHRRDAGDYDPALCLIPRDIITFIQTTQPQEWSKIKRQYKEEARKRFLQRLKKDVDKHGTIHVLRQGVKDVGARIQLAYFRPHSGLNPELQQKYAANIFSVVRQLRYSETTGHTLDLTIFLNGLPILTAELKDPLTGQSWKNAVSQYKNDRDPREPLFDFGRCLAHFAVDPDQVHFTTHLQGQETTFFPFNLGYNGGPGNPPRLHGYRTAYLWEQTWARDSVLDLLQNFVHIIQEKDDLGQPRGETKLIFPRHHQLDAVRRLVADAKNAGTGERYLIQHSAGSGKTYSISWLAHQLSVLHDKDDEAVFDSVIVISDRVVLVRQLQDHVTQFEQVSGVVEPIEGTSQDLKEALEKGKKIIVSTIQKFPYIQDEIQRLGSSRFAVVIDEAHSSQTGETARSMKAVLAAKSLEEAEEEDSKVQQELEDRILHEVEKRGPLPNVSHFAFTATPKAKTLELFGTQNEHGAFEPFSLYSMRQAIEEEFILDVLENYTTYRTFWKLLKTVQDDPRYDQRKAKYLLKRFVDLHEHTIEKKLEIIVEHFRQNVQSKIRGRAKAMIVTRSRLHAVRYKLVMDRYLREQGYKFNALVAFSGTVKDEGDEFTETAMNGFPQSQTADRFKHPDNRFMIVAEKFQTGFDQPLLYAMYVDKTLRGLHAVQTLSRLNRTYPGKDEPVVLDFANVGEIIQEAFKPYYEKTLLSEATDPHVLYDLETEIQGFHLYTQEELNRFAENYFNPKVNQSRLFSILDGAVDRFVVLEDEKREQFRSALNAYRRIYAFLSQVVSFADADLEKLYHFGRYLLKRLPKDEDALPVEVVTAVDLDTVRLQQTFEGEIDLPRGTEPLPPIGEKGGRVPQAEELEPLSQIIKELNELYGINLGPEAETTLGNLMGRLEEDEVLRETVRQNVPDNARLAFNHIAEDLVQDLLDSNFQMYKTIMDDRSVRERLFDWMFDQYREQVAGA